MTGKDAVLRRAAALAAGVVLAAAALSAGATEGPARGAHRDRAQEAADLRTYALETAMPAVLRHAERIASFGSRQTGQRGCDETAAYIRDVLERIGLENVQLHSAPVTAG